MIVPLPGGKTLEFSHVVFDYNGTIATNGFISNQVRLLLRDLSQTMHVTVITADTFGLAREQLRDLEDIKLVILEADENGGAKANYVRACGAETVIAIGNGVNDRPMLDVAGLAICVIGGEGASVKTLLSADVAVTEIEAAISLLLNPKRLVATLRS